MANTDTDFLHGYPRIPVLDALLQEWCPKFIHRSLHFCPALTQLHLQEQVFVYLQVINFSISEGAGARSDGIISSNADSRSPAILDYCS